MDLSTEEITMLYTALRDQHDNLLRQGPYKIQVDILMKKLTRLNLQKNWRLVEIR